MLAASNLPENFGQGFQNFGLSGHFRAVQCLREEQLGTGEPRVSGVQMFMGFGSSCRELSGTLALHQPTWTARRFKSHMSVSQHIKTDIRMPAGTDLNGRGLPHTAPRSIDIDDLKSKPKASPVREQPRKTRQGPASTTARALSGAGAVGTLNSDKRDRPP